MNIRSRKRFVVLAAAVTASATAVVLLHGDDTDHGAQGIRGSGVIVTETRSVTPFTRLELNGSANLKVTVGKPPSLAVHADGNLLRLIRAKVENGTLVISQHGNFTTVHGLEITVSTPALTAISLAGAGDVAVRGVDSQAFVADLSGAGRLDVDGKTTDARVTLEGAGAASLEHLLARDTAARISGTGTAHVYADRSLDATVDGVGSLVYRGDPGLVETHVSGVGIVVPE